jgi:hypothetical protein
MSVSRSVAWLAAGTLVAGTLAAACGEDTQETSATSGSGTSSSSGSTVTSGTGGGTTTTTSSGQGGSGGAVSTCGDGACTAGETCGSCVDDCGECCDDGTCGTQELCGTCVADCGACAGSAIDVVRGPYLQSGTPGSVVVRWRTATARDAVVAFGPAPDQLTRTATGSPNGTEHEVRIDGLAPDTKYFYAFGDPASTLWGGDADHFVVTSPTVGTDKPTRIWIIGDSGTANSNAENVRDAYLGFTAARGTDLWLMLGDNAYDDGTDAEFQDAVFDMYPSVLRNTVLWPTLGNHDGHTAASDTQSGPYYDIFTLPKQAEAGGVATGTEAYYAFDYGQIHFVCLDSYDSDRDVGGDMLTWLGNDLAANSQPWLIAFWHHPPYTKGSHDSDGEGALIDMRENALPILESYGVDLVLSGHSHSYERSFYLNGHHDDSDTLVGSMLIDNGDGRENGDGAYTRAAGSDDGAVYIVAGSSGKVSSAPLDHPAMYISLEELGSLVVDVEGTTMKANFIDDAGTQQDWFTISKP